MTTQELRDYLATFAAAMRQQGEQTSSLASQSDGVARNMLIALSVQSGVLAALADRMLRGVQS